MEDKTAPQTTARSWPDWVLIALLLLLAGGIHAWLMAHTVVAARDSIGYIRFALTLENEPWTQALQKADQHPGYPLAILVVSKPVRYFLGGTTAETMVLSAQLASAIAGTLLVIPMFLLGRLLFDRRAGFWAALLFQCLPVSAHVIGDAISEATFFLFLATSLLLAALALRNRLVLGLALCGVFGGLAYLTRPEGAIAVLAVLGVLFAMQWVRTQRWPWSRALAGATALLVGAVTVGGPYAATIGRFTPKRTGEAVMNIKLNLSSNSSAAPHAVVSSSVVGPTALFASVFAISLTPDPYGDHPVFFWEGLWAVVLMVSRAFQYVLWLPVLAGFWWFRARLRLSPGAWVLLVLCGLHALILWRMAALVAYVSERHALLIVFGGSFWAAAMLTTLVDALLQKRVTPRWQPMLTVALMAVLTGFSLPSVFKPMHPNRAGHLHAGHWLRDHADARDIIVDPYAWAHYYAGGVFHEGQSRPPEYQPIHWVVLEENSLTAHERLTGLDHAREIAKLGAPVYRWEPGPRDRKNRAAEVVIYRFPAPLPTKVSDERVSQR